jgi:hypothetical protein
LLGRSDREAYKRPHLSPVLSARRYLFSILHVSGNDSLRVGPDKHNSTNWRNHRLLSTSRLSWLFNVVESQRKRIKD